MCVCVCACIHAQVCVCVTLQVYFSSVLRLLVRGPCLSIAPGGDSGREKGSAVCPVGFQGPAETRGPPLCEEMIFSVLRRTLQIISSNLSNGPETLLPLSCNGDRWLAVQTGAIQTPSEGVKKPLRARSLSLSLFHIHTHTLLHTRTHALTHTYAHKHLHKMPLHWWPVWLRVIVSSQAVVLVVILNDHSQRGVLTIRPFKGKMIPLYRLTPEQPAAATVAASTATAGITGRHNTTFNVSAIEGSTHYQIISGGDKRINGIGSVLRLIHFGWAGELYRSCIRKLRL